MEHLLSALEQCGVDNARIEVEGGDEVPIIDGSALGWVINIQVVRLRSRMLPKSCRSHRVHSYDTITMRRLACAQQGCLARSAFADCKLHRQSH